MKALKIFYILCSLIFACGCTNNKSSNDVCGILHLPEAKEFDINNIASLDKIVALDTKDECLIGQIRQAYLLDTCIVIWDDGRSNIFVFNTDGKFLRKIASKGQDSKSYISIDAVYIDIKHKKINIIDNTKKVLLKYDLYGNYISTKQLHYCVYGYYPTAEGDWILNYLQDEKYNLLFVDKTTEKMRTGFLPSALLPLYKSNNFTKSDNDDIFFHFPYKNTIYKIQNNKLIPFLSVDFGANRAPVLDIDSPDFQKLIKGKSFTGMIHNLYVYKNLLFFSFEENNGSSDKLYNVYASLKDSTAFVTDFRLKHAEQVPISPLPEIIGLSAGKLIYQINPDILNGNHIKRLKQSPDIINAQNITLDSNPILVFYKLKE